MDVLDGDLEAVEGSRLEDLDFFHEHGCEVFEDNSVQGGEEGELMRDEVFLVSG